MIEQDSSNRFEKAMFNLLRSFNFIDHNVGLLIASTPNIGERSEIYGKLAKMAFNNRMTWLKTLLNESELSRHIGDDGVADFKRWLLDAQKARELRNKYVHAIWRFNPCMQSSPVCISPPSWLLKVPGNKIEYMSLDELDFKVAMVEKTFRNLCKLRKQYGV